MPFPQKLKAFDPKTGKELWWCGGMGPLAYASPICSADGIVVAFSGFHGAALAVRAGGRGDVTKQRLWHQTVKNPQRIGSPVLVGDYCYMPGEDVVQCIELKTGKDVWERQRLGSKTWCTPVLVGDKLLLPDETGKVHVLAASPTFHQIGNNSIGNEMTRSSLAVAEGELFLRTYRHLWCIGKK
jgi:outer membrane protein assembly factor BamB